jgi:hypothetical protein
MGKGYTGYYKPINKEKYIGNINKIYYRSLWERSFCKWCDKNVKVMEWAIEPFDIPYYDQGKRKNRRYNPDFYVLMQNGTKYLIEIKPDHETKPPTSKKGTKRYLLAESTYITNRSKWNAATEYCRQHNLIFKVMTEYTLNDMGIRIMKKNKKHKKRQRRKKRS